jgi:hypothetical protein
MTSIMHACASCVCMESETRWHLCVWQHAQACDAVCGTCIRAYREHEASLKLRSTLNEIEMTNDE